TGVRWAEQSPQLGTGHAVRCARVAFQTDAEDLLVTCGDMPLVAAETYRKLVALRHAAAADAAMLTVRIPPASPFGRILRDADGRVAGIVEYKDADEQQRAIAEGNAGVYCFRPPALWFALEAIRNDNAQGEYYLTDVIAVILARGGTVVSMVSDLPGEELGVNTPEDLECAARALAERGTQ
ncbi:MAG: NTP transferase domain-containing protein, partial [Planctomycetes bacterium]|nr:NTP transferase domain-containing protein [Planctomycetota bacterium]